MPREERPLDTDVLQYLQEACYYLHKKGLTYQEVSEALEIPAQEAMRLFQEYEFKIAQGLARENEVDKALWEDVFNDSIGNEKVTFVRRDEFYHCRRSDLAKMDSQALMAAFETSRKFLDFDMYKPYLGTKPPVGYDPMALQRQVKRAMDIIEKILKQRWEKEGKKN